MRILYVFPHPDDESFGPAGVIHQQVQRDYEVYLLTLTRGGATQQRHKLGLSVEQMGEVRYQEMQEVSKLLKLHDMRVLNYPDSGLSELDPRVLEREVRTYIEWVQPQVVVTYPVHGASGYHDHLVTHAVVKRVFVTLRDEGANYLKRLAFFTMPDSGEPTFLPSGWPRLKLTHTDLIDCIVPLSAEEVEAMKRALSCYKTYQEVVTTTGVIAKIGNQVYFEIFDEDFAEPLLDLTASLQAHTGTPP